MFERGKRENDMGDLVEWISGSGGPGPKPNLKLTHASYMDNEIAFTKLLDTAIQR
jgi:hypothetical protein